MKTKILRALRALRIPLVLLLLPPPLYAMNAVSPGTRDEVIETALNGLGGSEQATELAAIRIKAGGISASNADVDAYLIARALHLYNQRRLSDAKGDLTEILMSSPDNQSAIRYLGDISSKFEASAQTPQRLREEIKGVESVENAQLGGIDGREEFGSTDGEERLTSNTAFVSTKVNENAKDQKNQFIAEALKWEGGISDYKYTATANLNYYNNDNRRENVRLRNAAWWMKNEKLQLIAGDTSSYLSRYVLNGINYRGTNLKMDMYQDPAGGISDRLTFLYGKVPYYWLTEDEYIYPREVAAARNELSLWGWWDMNASFSYLLDNSSRIAKIDSNNKAKKNALLGIDQTMRLIPGVWTLYEETALSYADEDRLADAKALKSWATYLVSDFKTKTVKLYNSYERVNPNFRSYLGLTGFSANNQLTINREHSLNVLDYSPLDWMDFGLQYSKTRMNLDKKYDTETIEENNYKANLKVMPKNNLPAFSLRSSVWTSACAPGPVSAPKENSSWDTVFGMAKTIRETDWSASYGVRGYSQFINFTNTYGDALEHTFTLSASRKLCDRLAISPSYTLSRAHLIKKPNRDIYSDRTTSHLFDLNLGAGLWDTAHLTLDYNLSSTEDFATPSVWDVNNAFTTTFSWPFTTTLGFRKKLVFSPYLSYHYSTGKATLLDRNYFAGRLEGDYFLTDNSKLNLSGEYRSNNPSDPAYVGFSDEYRIMLNYKTHT